MKKITPLYYVLSFLLVGIAARAQVGIGTLEPDASAFLDLKSNSQGMLAPRMTTTERLLIAQPANGLLVYDTTENSFYFYKQNVWAKQDASVGTRNNYKLVKSAADLSEELAASGGNK